MTAYFVTGIGTEIGKTYVSAALLRAWHQTGHAVGAVKPLMSGFSEEDLVASDAGQLLSAMGRTVTPQTVSEVCLHRFEDPIAPNVAMRQAGMAQDYAAIVDFARSRCVGDGLALVEGAGGIMSPVTDDKLHTDLMVDLGLPVILVAASYLGAVSHTLSAIHTLRSLGLEIAAVIVSQPTADAQSPDHLIGEVRRWRDEACFAVVHGGDANEVAAYLV